MAEHRVPWFRFGLTTRNESPNRALIKIQRAVILHRTDSIEYEPTNRRICSPRLQVLLSVGSLVYLGSPAPNRRRTHGKGLLTGFLEFGRPLVDLVECSL